MDLDKLSLLVSDYITNCKSDVYLYSGPIAYEPACSFVDCVNRKNNIHEVCLFFLTTFGGDPHAAYRIIRALRRKYKTVRLCVVGPCKSAGTLMSLGAHELVMAETGELGPLDVQLAKPDEIIPNSSGLDIIEALAVTTETAFQMVEQRMFDLVEHSLGSISTKTAAEISTTFAVELFKPIMAQIEPDRLGEVQRAIKIAQAYGERLGTPNLRTGSMKVLVDGYPSHGFVIDMEEAKKLYRSVSPIRDEAGLVNEFRPMLRHARSAIQYFDAEATFVKAKSGATNGAGTRNQRNRPNISTSDARGKGIEAPDSDHRAGSSKTSSRARQRSSRGTPAVAHPSAPRRLDGVDL